MLKARLKALSEVGNCRRGIEIDDSQRSIAFTSCLLAQLQHIRHTSFKTICTSRDNCVSRIPNVSGIQHKMEFEN